jgi:hypothetical protein
MHDNVRFLDWLRLAFQAWVNTPNGLNSSLDRRILVQRKVYPRVVVIVPYVAQVPFAEDNK